MQAKEGDENNQAGLRGWQVGLGWFGVCWLAVGWMQLSRRSGALCPSPSGTALIQDEVGRRHSLLCIYLLLSEIGFTVGGTDEPRNTGID